MKNSVSKLLDGELAKLFATFKPEFGNADHIQIVRIQGEIAKKQEELDRATEASQRKKTIKSDIEQMKSNLLYWLKK